MLTGGRKCKATWDPAGSPGCASFNTPPGPESGAWSGHHNITTTQETFTGEVKDNEACPFKATSDHPSPPIPPRAGQTSEWSEGANKDFLGSFLQHFRSISSNLSAELHSSCFPPPFFHCVYYNSFELCGPRLSCSQNQVLLKAFVRLKILL